MLQEMSEKVVEKEIWGRPMTKPNRIKLSPETFAQAAEVKTKTRCPECDGMLVYSMDKVECNKCGWEPENDKKPKKR